MSESPFNTKSAGIVIIGNEILSGKVIDSNSSFLVSELRSLGVDVRRILVIPDDITTIGEEVSLFSKRYDHVFTSGGIGPTHDDVTTEGIAAGFGVKILLDTKLMEWFTKRYGDAINDSVLKMTLVPEGAELLDTGENNLPVVLFRNIVIFPGIPQLLKKKFFAIRERFRCSNFHFTRLFINADEAHIADSLSNSATANPDVTIGSYPFIGNSEYKIIVTLESKSYEALKQAKDELLRLLPEKFILKVEDKL